MAGDHERHEHDVGAYLLGALPPLDAEVFERHLMGCDACRDEVERLRPAVEALPRAVEPFEPPASLKVSLMEIVEAEAAARGTATDAATAPAVRGDGPLARLGRALGGVRPRAALAVAGIALLAGVALGLGLTAGSGEDDTREVVATVDRVKLPAASAELKVAGDEAAVLQVTNMPRPPQGKVYEVWVERNGSVRPAGALFTVDRDGNGSAAIPGGVDGVSQVMVTREIALGADQPTEPPVIRVDV